MTRSILAWPDSICQEIGMSMPGTRLQEILKRRIRACKIPEQTVQAASVAVRMRLLWPTARGF